ncbi:MAG: pantoate--beta-alanine ligase [Bdellovibrionota bacterium]
MMRVLESIEEWLRFRNSSCFFCKTLGFIPTMGALHDGHISLVERSISENDFTLVSIFVNPTQFDDKRDLEKYPRTIESDLGMLGDAGAHFVLTPRYEDIYADGYKYRVTESELSKVLCGAHRPGHFDGVLTVVMKLLNIASADRAYFGEKDYQQLLLIKGMTESFFMKTTIVPCATSRETDGLARSSRNRLLSKNDRQKASLFHDILASKRLIGDVAEQLRGFGFDVDYIEERFGRRFGAVKLGKVRLIDNVPI